MNKLASAASGDGIAVGSFSKLAMKVAITADKSEAVLCGQVIFAAERASCTG